MRIGADAEKNRAYWDAQADAYQARNDAHIGRAEPRWGMWQLPEDELQILGDVAGKDVLELGCGAAQWSVLLAKRGARIVGLDNSERQLAHARRRAEAANVSLRLEHAAAEHLPFEDDSFDIAFCDHGAMTFSDPYQTVPEVARVLRPGGLFAFSHTTPLSMLFFTEESLEETLRQPYFGMHRIEWADGAVEFNLPYGEWLRLFRANAFVVEDLVEIRPPEGAPSTYRNEAETEWARRWPAEQIWKLRKS